MATSIGTNAFAAYSSTPHTGDISCPTGNTRPFTVDGLTILRLPPGCTA